MEVAERAELESTGHLEALARQLWQDALDHLGGLARQIAMDVSAIVGEMDGSRSRLMLVGPESANAEREDPVDEVVAFWMLSDAPDADAVIRSAMGALRQGGRLLLVEPDVPGEQSALGRAVESARSNNMRLISEPRVTLSRAALLVRE